MLNVVLSQHTGSGAQKVHAEAAKEREKVLTDAGAKFGAKLTDAHVGAHKFNIKCVKKQKWC